MANYDPNAVMPVRMEYIGMRTGAVTYPGARGSGRTYRGGRNPINRYHNVHPADVATLEGTGEWKRVAPAITEPQQTTPQAAPVAEAVSVPSVLAVGELELETVAEAAPVSEQIQIVDTAEGPVKRKRATAKKTTKNSKLRDLPPLG